MNIDGLKNVKISSQRTQMTFCASCKSCPAIDISTDSNTVVVGGEDEGFTEFTKDQFELFVKTVKEGAFDRFFVHKKDCVCGTTSDPDGKCDGSHSGVCNDEGHDQNEIGFGD